MSGGHVADSLKKKKKNSTRAQPCSTIRSGWTVSGRGKKNVGMRARQNAFFYSSHMCSLTCVCRLSVISPVLRKIYPLVPPPPRNRVDYWEAAHSDVTRGRGTSRRRGLFLSPSKRRFFNFFLAEVRMQRAKHAVFWRSM